MTSFEQLQQWGATHTSCVVAFSGGVDSTFLLTALSQYTSMHIRAVTMAPPYVPLWEIAEAKELAAKLQIEHVVIPMELPEEIRENPVDRCYLCKRILFTSIIERAAEWGVDLVIDGTNADDASDYRPGMRALRDLHVQSPLLTCGFTKEAIRSLCRDWGLSIADKPAYSCLLTRIPHNTSVQLGLLRRIETAERFLHALGFLDVRVRVHGEIARIEVAKEQFTAFCTGEHLETVNKHLKQLGFTHVTLDLAGYQQGSMNIEPIRSDDA